MPGHKNTIKTTEKLFIRSQVNGEDWFVSTPSNWLEEEIAIASIQHDLFVCQSDDLIALNLIKHDSKKSMLLDAMAKSPDIHQNIALIIARTVTENPQLVKFIKSYIRNEAAEDMALYLSHNYLEDYINRHGEEAAEAFFYINNSDDNDLPVMSDVNIQTILNLPAKAFVNSVEDIRGKLDHQMLLLNRLQQFTSDKSTKGQKKVALAAKLLGSMAPKTLWYCAEILNFNISMAKMTEPSYASLTKPDSDRVIVLTDLVRDYWVSLNSEKKLYSGFSLQNNDHLCIHSNSHTQGIMRVYEPNAMRGRAQNTLSKHLQKYNY